MKTKLMLNMYDFECRLFRSVNRHFDRKFLNFYFRHITHVGGASATILFCLLLITLSEGTLRLTGIACAASLLLSHLPVAAVKKLYPRKRPYLALLETRFPNNPLEDHSFPSGHTTAIFSVLIPVMLFSPVLLGILLPLAISVGISRIYLGLHYPSDVLAGCLLGTSAGFAAYTAVMYLFENIFILA
ncbi:phosphatase PAP2 family protein [Bacillus lacus]|uniref:Phosphatase PAP2 family protein n=1 Tax=Metabacillus lacus TaxID=1983721 RepID=A0A7X2LZ13_9BACI|nr:phosphatase PAP2 family protein [Metabacillus lacus]MRX72383.1 phosphatase PAP2 family protein [Metabacillus lacus]